MSGDEFEELRRRYPWIRGQDLAEAKTRQNLGLPPGKENADADFFVNKDLPTDFERRIRGVEISRSHGYQHAIEATEKAVRETLGIPRKRKDV